MELYEDSKSRWPSVFRIIREKSKASIVKTDPSEFEVYRDIENKIGDGDEWSHLAAWAFHQALGMLVKKSYIEQKLLIPTRLVTFEIFDRQIRANLADDSWHEERAVYERLPLGYHRR